MLDACTGAGLPERLARYLEEADDMERGTCSWEDACERFEGRYTAAHSEFDPRCECSDVKKEGGTVIGVEGHLPRSLREVPKCAWQETSQLYNINSDFAGQLGVLRFKEPGGDNGITLTLSSNVPLLECVMEVDGEPCDACAMVRCDDPEVGLGWIVDCSNHGFPGTADSCTKEGLTGPFQLFDVQPGQGYLGTPGGECNTIVAAPPRNP